MVPTPPIPTTPPDDTVLKDGDCIVIDIGCKKDYYCSDMTRTYFWKRADPEYVKIYDIVRRANETAEAMVKAGVPLMDIDITARDIISEAGYGEYFTPPSWPLYRPWRTTKRAM